MAVDIIADAHNTTEAAPWYVKVAMPVVLAAALGLGLTAWSRATAVESRLTRSEVAQESLREAAIALRATQTDLGFRVDAAQTNINNRFDTVLDRIFQLNTALSRIEGHLSVATASSQNIDPRRERAKP